jgi:hypothetical protein
MVPASVFRHALGTDPRICEYQVRQTLTGAEILTVGSPDVTELTISLAAALRRHGLPNPQLQIRIVSQIQRHEATGKLRRFIAMLAGIRVSGPFLRAGRVTTRRPRRGMMNKPPRSRTKMR